MGYLNLFKIMFLYYFLFYFKIQKNSNMFRNYDFTVKILVLQNTYCYTVGVEKEFRRDTYA